jgi:hypothetical protein
LCSCSSPPRRATQVSLDASGAVSGAKSYPRLLQADCVVRGDDLDADMDVLRKSDASCEVAFADYLLPGETVRAASLSVALRGDFDGEGEFVRGLDADGAEVAGRARRRVLALCTPPPTRFTPESRTYSVPRVF